MRNSRSLRVMVARESFERESIVHDVGLMTECCDYCDAFRYNGETKSICCNAGKVKVHPLSPAPSDLLELFDEPEFRNNIRNYNNAMAFTSLGNFI